MQHLDDAQALAREFLTGFLRDKEDDCRVLLVTDVSARFSVILWCDDWKTGRDEIDEGLRRVSSKYWSGRVLRGRSPQQLPDGPWQKDAWEQASSCGGGADGLRVLERHRAKAGWFEAPDEPRWSIAGADAPRVVLFYSFKGGVGRSTALAACALHLASGGDRVVVLDADLDSPGVGSLLGGLDGITTSWGVVDYLLERPVVEDADFDLDDYYHRVPSSLFSGGGEILVFPAGTPGDGYIDKLARLDYGVPQGERKHPFVGLLDHVREELDPGWLLIDARAGLGDVSGFLTGGLCHLHVLFGTMAEASWRGLGMVVDRLGGDRLRRDATQAECIMVAAMVPRTREALYRELVEQFAERGRNLFTEHYYAQPDPGSGSGEDIWTVDDLEDADAPHVPTALPYDERLAVFHDLSEVAGSILLKDEPYGVLAERLRESFERLKAGTG